MLNAHRGLIDNLFRWPVSVKMGWNVSEGEIGSVLWECLMWAISVFVRFEGISGHLCVACFS